MEELNQNTEQWLKWRNNGLGGSDLPIIMNNSPYKTPHQLWLEKTGKEQPKEVNKFVTNKGHELEVIARNKYEIETGYEWKPILAEHSEFPHFRSSLDGFNKELNACWECKYIGAEFFEGVKKGILPEKYKAQVHWQMFVTGATKNHFTVINDEHEIATMIVDVDIDYCALLAVKATEFWNWVKEDIEPPLVDADKIKIEGCEFETLIQSYRQKDFEVKQAKKELDQLKASIFKKLPHTNCFYEDENFKVTMQVQERIGTVDNKVLYETYNISEKELERFRKPSSKVKVIKVKELKK
jgi:putative phage-type endonuclease